MRILSIPLRRTLARCQGAYRSMPCPCMHRQGSGPRLSRLLLSRCTHLCVVVLLLLSLVSIATAPVWAEDVATGLGSSSAFSVEANESLPTARASAVTRQADTDVATNASAHSGRLGVHGHEAEQQDTHGDSDRATASRSGQHVSKEENHRVAASTNAYSHSTNPNVSLVHETGITAAMYTRRMSHNNDTNDTHTDTKDIHLAQDGTEPVPQPLSLLPSPTTTSATTTAEATASSFLSATAKQARLLLRQEQQQQQQRRHRQHEQLYAWAMRSLYLHKNLTLFVSRVTHGAAAGQPRLQWLLGVLHAHGVGVPYNESRAMELYRLAAHSAGGVVPESHAALLYRYHNDRAHTLEQRCQAASQGHVRWLARAVKERYSRRVVTDSQWLPPHALRDGVGEYAAAGTETDGRDGHMYRRRLFTQELKRAQYGQTRRQMQLLTLEADGGSAWAMLRLGMSYLHGMLGVRPNWHRSRQYLREAATRNNQEALGAMGLLYLYGDVHGEPAIARNVPKAYEYFERGIKHKDATSYLGMAWLYAHGYLQVHDNGTSLQNSTTRANHSTSNNSGDDGGVLGDTDANHTFVIHTNAEIFREDMVAALHALNRFQQSAVAAALNDATAPASFRYAVQLLNQCSTQGSIDCTAYLADLICTRDPKACDLPQVMTWIAQSMNHLSSIWHIFNKLRDSNDLLTCQSELILYSKMKIFAEWHNPYSPSVELATADWLDYENDYENDDDDEGQTPTNSDSDRRRNSSDELRSYSEKMSRASRSPSFLAIDPAAVERARQNDERHIRLLHQRRRLIYCQYTSNAECAALATTGEDDMLHDYYEHGKKTTTQGQDHTSQLNVIDSTHKHSIRKDDNRNTTPGNREHTDQYGYDPSYTTSVHSSSSLGYQTTDRGGGSTGMQSRLLLAVHRAWNRVHALRSTMFGTLRSLLWHWLPGTVLDIIGEMTEKDKERVSGKSGYGLRRRTPLVSLIESLAMAETGQAGSAWRAIELLDDFITVPGESWSEALSVAHGIVDAHNVSLAGRQTSAQEQKAYAAWLNKEMNEHTVQLHWTGPPTEHGVSSDANVVQQQEQKASQNTSAVTTIATTTAPHGDSTASHSVSTIAHSTAPQLPDNESRLSHARNESRPDQTDSGHPPVSTHTSAHSSSSSHALLPPTSHPLSQLEAKHMLLLRMLQSPSLRKDGEALRQLGDFYYYGISHSIGVDLDKAFAHYTAAAMQNDSHAIFNLAMMHQLGLFGSPARRVNKAAMHPIQRVLYSVRAILVGESDLTTHDLRRAYECYARLTDTFSSPPPSSSLSVSSSAKVAHWMARWGMLSLNLQWWYMHFIVNQHGLTRALHLSLPRFGAASSSRSRSSGDIVPTAAAKSSSSSPETSQSNHKPPTRTPEQLRAPTHRRWFGAGSSNHTDSSVLPSTWWNWCRSWWREHVKARWQAMTRDVSWIEMMRFAETAMLASSVTVLFGALLIRQHAI